MDLSFLIVFMIIQHLKKKIPYTVLKMKWPIGGANMVNDFYIPCSLRNNSAIQRLLTIIYCRISNNFSTYFSCTIFTPPCPNLPLSSFAPPPPIILMGYFWTARMWWVGQKWTCLFFILSFLKSPHHCIIKKKNI